MTEAHRSECPINLPLEVCGGKSGLLVLRDIIDSFSAPYSLRVRFFGRFEVLCNDEVVPWAAAARR
jgi:hypothetical protein